MNDPVTLLKRRASTVGALSSFEVPPFPRLPQVVIDRFPDLLAYEQRVIQWANQLNSTLQKALSTPTT